VIHPHQFFSPTLQTLLKKETDLWLAKCAAKEKITKGEEVEDPSIYELSDHDLKLKEMLLSQGFLTWTKTDFREFVKANAQFGRKSIEDIAHSVGTKTVEETRSYSQVFWSRLKELPEWEKIENSITKGEAKLEQNRTRILSLEAKVETTNEPWFKMFQSQSKSFWTPEEDNFLLCTTYQKGFGNWDAIKTAIEQDPVWSFDFFLITRSPGDLERRCLQLLKIIEKEHTEAGTDLLSYAKNRPKPPSRICDPTGEELMEVETKKRSNEPSADEPKAKKIKSA